MHGSGNQASCGKLLINAHLIVPGDWSVGSECWPRGSVYCWKDHVVRCDRQSAHCHWQRKQLAGWESSLTQVVIPGGWSWTVQLTFCCTILLRILAFVNTVVPGIQFAFSEGLATFQYLYEIHKGFQKSDRLISKEINTDVIWNCNFRFWPRFLNFTRVLFQELSTVTSFIASLGTKPWISLTSYCSTILKPSIAHRDRSTVSSPLPPPLQGSGIVKAGFAGEEYPKVHFSS